MPVANVWVTCGSGVIVYNRGPVTVEVSHNVTDFVTNTQTAGAEQCLAVAVSRSSWLSELVLT